MIDTQRETLITLRQAAQRLPGRDAENVSVQTVRRWMKQGVYGDAERLVRLEWVRVGCRLCTSVEALDRFMRRTSGFSDPTPPQKVPLEAFAQFGVVPVTA